MRTTARLTPDRLVELRATQAPCARCLHWELDPVQRAAVRRGARTEEQTSAEKDAWLSTVLREWGSCGRVLLVDEAVVGHVVYAPAGFVPGAACFATAPVSPDAVLLSTIWVAPEHRGAGLGRRLVQAMAADLIERGDLRAIEAFGAAGRRNAASACVPPAEFLARVGFRTVRPHRSTPRLRMDLRTAATWRDEVESALGRLVRGLRPSPAPLPAPAGRTDTAPRPAGPVTHEGPGRTRGLR